MQLNQVKKIKIHAFRGIPDLELELDGKNLIVKGENGTGKSSIVESFEFFFTGNLSNFEGEGTQDLSLIKHAPNKNFHAADVVIGVSFDPGNIILERTFMTTPEPPAHLKKYFEEAYKGTFILRRSQILEFIISQPADKFRAIASIIGIDQLDNVELSMKRACDALKGTVLSKQSGIDSIYTNISNQLGQKVSSSKQALNVLNSSLTKAGLSSIASFKDVVLASTEFLKGFKSSGNLEEVLQLDALIQELKQFKIDEGILQLVNATADQLEPLLNEKVHNELFLRDFLSKGLEALETTEADTCPLCGQGIDREILLEKIKIRLQTLYELSNKANAVRELFSTAEGRLNWQITSLQRINAKIEPFEHLKDSHEKLIQAIKDLSNLKERYLEAKLIAPEKQVPKNDFKCTFETINVLIDSLKSKCLSLFESTEISGDWKTKLEAITLANRVGALISEIDINKKSVANEQKQLALAEKLYKIFSDTKKEKIAEIYDSIKVNVNSFYSTLHPYDPHRNIEINVVANRRASTQLRIESFGSVEDPRAFTSEGHLDSLGLCIFLAFAKKFNQDCSLILLDDVVTTIDAQHRGLIAKLLFEEFKSYQLVITTHDSIWYEQLCAAENAYGVGGNCKNMEIVKWSLESGPQLEPYKPHWESIVNRINSGDKNGAGEEGRVYLEWLLKRICLNTQAQVPFKTDRYTVADLYEPAKSRLLKLVSDYDFKQMLVDSFMELESITLMGNLLSHDNAEAGNASIEEVERFCLAIHAIRVILQCPECDTFLKYYQDLKRIKCSNGRCHTQTEII